MTRLGGKELRLRLGKLFNRPFWLGMGAATAAISIFSEGVLLGSVAVGGAERVALAWPMRFTNPVWAVGVALFLLILGAAAASIRAIMVAQRISRAQLKSLTSALDEMGAGHLDIRLPMSGGPLDDLSDHVNDMAERLAELVRLLQDQSDHIRHEYANSAGRMGAFLERIRIHEAELSPMVADAVTALERERNHFIRLTEGILSLWRARRGGLRVYEQDLAVLAGESADVQEGRAEEKQIELTTTLLPAPTMGDGQELTLLVTNLLGNAIKFAPRGGRVELSCGVLGGRVILTVDDNGPGIPVDKRSIVFERRLRLPDTEHEEGNGLGLAIVDAIIKAHRGSIEITDSPLGGARFRVNLPLARQLPL